MCTSWDPAKRFSHSALVPFTIPQCQLSYHFCCLRSYFHDWANLTIKDRPKNWWAQTKLQSTEQRGFWGRKVLHTELLRTWILQGNQRWSQGLATRKASLEAADGPRRGTMLQGRPPTRLLWNTTAALFCITGNCNVILNLLVYGWLRMCFLVLLWWGHVPNRMLAGGWTTTMAVLNDLRMCLIPRAAHLKATAQMPVSIELIGTSQKETTWQLRVWWVLREAETIGGNLSQNQISKHWRWPTSFRPSAPSDELV